MLLANGARIAPQALSELTPQLSTSYYYPNSAGVQLERTYALYGEIYASQPHVYSVIRKLAQSVARLPTVVWNEAGATRVKDSTSAFARMMTSPCPYLSPFAFWENTVSWLYIYGESFWAIVRDDATGKPKALLPMHPSRVAIRRDPDTGAQEFQFQAGAGTGSSLVTFSEDDVVPIRFFNPRGTERGLSPMDPLRSTIFAEDSSRTAVAASYGNGGRPNIVLSTDKELGEQGKTRLRNSWNATHAGSSNAGKALVLEDGLKALPIQLTNVELQMIETRQLNREEVCMAFDIAPPMVHILDRATFSNISAQMRAFYRDTMAVPIERLEDATDWYVGASWTGNTHMKFAVEEVTRGDYEQRAQTAQAMVVIGAWTPNEAREFMGYDRSDNPKADELYANSAQQPLGEPAEQVRLTGQVANDPDGIALAPVAAAVTPVPSLTTGAEATPVPQLTAKQEKHLHAVKSELGRGRDIAAFARDLGEKYPDDLEDILIAVKCAIAERNAKEQR